MAGFEPTKGSSVEVSSDDPGFQGAWYVAPLVDVVDDSPTKKKLSSKKNRTKKKMGYLVSYDTLFEEDNMDVHLTEVVDPSIVRPMPPRNVRRKNDSEAVAEAEAEGGGDIEQFDVVDAFHRYGWWIGVVKRVITDGEISKYVVWFENPPEEVEFERSQLRLHVDWVDCHWQVPPKKKTPEQDLAATHTSESSNDYAHSGLATPPSKEGVSDKRKSLSLKKHNETRAGLCCSTYIRVQQ